MYLKKIKMKGFKSFAENVELEFDKGIAAVVGPNGSGKSNIVDAIRWVLGEQSTKTLRGKKMEDVIFAGTENKAPLSYAEVAITLDCENTAEQDQDDVIIVSRKLFRTGESEYFLNNKPCKLKEIHALFFDTGLGKNGYSVINQGEIESITNSGPQELRRIVEEAVGIVGYKTKKQEAERKLASAQDNMDRIQDIADELEKQLKPLKRQSEKARQYLEIYDELKALDLYFFKTQMEAIAEKKQQYTIELDELERVIFDINTKLRNIDRQYQDKKQTIRMKEAKKQQLREETDQTAEVLTKANSDMLVGEERCRNLEASAARLSEEKAKLEQKYADCLSELTAVIAETDKLDAVLQGVETELKGIGDQKNAIQGQLAALTLLEEKAHVEEEEKNNLKLKTMEEVQALQKQIGALETQQKLQDNAADQAAAKKQALSESIEAAEKQIRLQKTRITDLQDRENESKTQGRALNAQMESLIQNLNLLNNNVTVNRSKIEYLQSVEASYSDYLPGIQLIMRQNGMANIYGPVGELLQVASKYATAIDVALGRKTQNIVVKDVKTAHRCIELLKNKKAGRATFLPLETLKQYTISQKDLVTIKNTEGIIGVASDLVQCAPTIKPVAEHLLNRTLVAVDFQSAEKNRRNLSQFTIVTLQGEIFYSSGAVVGGSIKNGQHSPLYKKIEISQLQEENNKLQNEITRMTAESEVIKERRSQWQMQHDAIGNQLAALKEQLWHSVTDLEHLNQQIDELSSEQAFDEVNSTDLERALQELAQKQALIDGLDSERSFDDHEKRNALTEALSQLDAQNAEVQTQKAQLLSEAAAADQRKQHCKQRQAEIQKELEENQNAIAAEEAAIAEVQSDIAQSKADGETAQQKNAALRSEYEAIDSELIALTAAVENFDREIRELNHELLLQNETQHHLELEKQKLISKTQYSEETIYNRYGLNTIMAFDEVKKTDLSAYTVTEERCQALRMQLSALGQVNTEAIEKYVEVKERYDFMSAQIADITQAKKELMTIIRDLTRAMEKQFADGFERLQHIFSDVFAVLFEGGHAQLRYADPDNIMDSGIELTAQPPGKNLKHLALLSGGEKSMTAIALLFAFIQLNPTPFCVIDEIDAALDDQNIMRFTRYMNAIAGENQFILITHRKKTLEVCNTIYGVTMSLSGISKCVSMRLSDYIETSGGE